MSLWIGCTYYPENHSEKTNTTISYTKYRNRDRTVTQGLSLNDNRPAGWVGLHTHDGRYGGTKLAARTLIRPVTIPNRDPSVGY